MSGEGRGEWGHDARFMRRALSLAELGWGRVHPNPLVGAVVVRDGEVVGEGAHRRFGGPHAEIEALEQAGPRARGATLYVTLEPCAHRGKTPPCTDAIRAAGVSRVVYAASDPHPDARGGGDRLREAGIDVAVGVEEHAARVQNALFLLPLERGRPFVALKLGTTLDGRIADRAGETARITGPAAQVEVHRLRSGFDAVLVGGRTARIDDPRLTVRDAAPPGVPPIRVVVSAGADLPPNGRLVRSADEAPVWVVASADAPPDRVERLRSAGVTVLAIERGEDGLDPAAVVARLGEEGCNTLLCEGGGRFGAALLRADVVDRLYLFFAPRFAGESGVPAFPGPAPGFRGHLVDVRRVGDDALLVVDRSE